MPRKNGKKPARKFAAGERNLLTRIVHPPQISQTTQARVTQRFRATAAFSGTAVSPLALCLAFGCIGTNVNSTVRTWWQTVRVVSVRMWGLPYSSSVDNTVSLVWTTLAQNLTTQGNNTASDTSMSTAFPSFISTRPPRMNTAAFFNPAADVNALWTMWGPIGCIIDVTVDLIADTTGSTLNGVSGLSTVVLGAKYNLALDNNGSTSHNIPPVAPLTTTF